MHCADFEAATPTERLKLPPEYPTPYRLAVASVFSNTIPKYLKSLISL